MNRTLSVKNNDLNHFLKCPQCKGYLIDSFTINECLHSFCKSCIIKYIKRKECCPVCKIPINRDRMRLFLRRDVNLQYIVYKLVPGLFKREMQRRKAFYNARPKAVKFLKKRRIWDKEAVGEQEDEFSFTQEKQDEISLSIEYSQTGLSEICESARNKDLDPDCQRTYLLCPALITIDLLKKFLKLKNQDYEISKIDIMYDDTPLKKEMTLLDVAYIYAWRRKSPMRLFFRINKDAVKDEKTEEPEVIVPIISELAEKPTIEIITKSPIASESNLNETMAAKSPQIEPTLPTELSDKIPIVKKELFQPQFETKNMCVSDQKESENLEEIPVEYNQPCSVLNNQTLNNETLTIASMMQSIGSGACRSIDMIKESKSVALPDFDENEDKSEYEMIVDRDQVDIGSGSDKENSVNLMDVKAEPERDEKNLAKETETSLASILLSTVDACKDIQNKTSPSKNITQIEANPQLNNNTNQTKAIKSKKNPAAPDSAGGVAKKKKDALTPNNNNNNLTTNLIGSNTINKKPKATKPKKPTAKQLQQQNHHGQLFDPTNVQIKQQPVEPSNIPSFYKPNESNTHFPQIKLEKTYNTQQTFNPQISALQQQIQQQFSLPSPQSLFNNTKNSSASGSLPSLQNILSSVSPANNGNSQMVNNFQHMPMSLMNHFFNNQHQQQQNWNQLKNTQLVANALQMGNKLNPTQLFEYLQSKTSQSLSTQQPQINTQNHYNQQHQSHQPNIFNSNLQQNQFFSNQYEDFKVPFPASCYQDRGQVSSVNSHSYFNSQGNDNFKYTNMAANQYNQFYQSQQMPNNMSSNSSTCSSEGICSVDNNVKENPLRSIISESCNLVNELN